MVNGRKLFATGAAILGARIVIYEINHQNNNVVERATYGVFGTGLMAVSLITLLKNKDPDQNRNLPGQRDPNEPPSIYNDHRQVHFHDERQVHIHDERRVHIHDNRQVHDNRSFLYRIYHFFRR